MPPTSDPTLSGVNFGWTTDTGIPCKGALVGIQANQEPSTSLLDQRLGFGEWFSRLTPQQAKTVAIGPADAETQLIIFHPIAAGTAAHDGTPGDRALVFDYEANKGQGFVSEFRGTDMEGVTYAAHFRSDSLGGQLWMDNGYRYPVQGGVGWDSGQPGAINVSTEIEWWVSENINRPKTVGFIEIELGPRSGTGDITIRIEAHDHPTAGTEYASTGVPLTYTLSGNSTTGDKLRIPDFIGMRGRLFRILISGASGKQWEIQKIKFEYEFDKAEDLDARSQ